MPLLKGILNVYFILPGYFLKFDINSYGTKKKKIDHILTTFWVRYTKKIQKRAGGYGRQNSKMACVIFVRAPPLNTGGICK